MPDELVLLVQKIVEGALLGRILPGERRRWCLGERGAIEFSTIERELPKLAAGPEGGFTAAKLRQARLDVARALVGELPRESFHRGIEGRVGELEHAEGMPRIRPPAHISHQAVFKDHGPAARERL